ncbi:MAG TPA: pyruvate formate lyase family protein [Deltaproteobacteria bacterium]|jgi:formate C-acetyltransferase|nr:formate acetyltransferase [Bacteriovoracaceae bacterium]HON62599.1 pyruvate formate lyase family protein [Deltaproteobacteria bacterium]HRR19855.1 pyruvate formate lyase family protein [Desulfomonilia bacterium]HPA83652.1 pyruvate formate lyase family protein [Deltaproteobacteria bacterium]HPX49200.1 pyruvate formate lyase family protein [Deltaproteobacteria bacterium]
MAQRDIADIITHTALRTMALHFNYLPKFRKYLRTDDGWINFSLGMRTEQGNVRQCITFKDGKVRVKGDIPANVDTEMVFFDNGTLKDMASLPPNEVLNLILKNKLIVRGNLVYAQLFSFFITLFVKGKIINMMKKQAHERSKESCEQAVQPAAAPPPRVKKQLSAPARDPGVVFLDDPYLSQYSLSDFPRLEKFLDIHFTRKPAICHERPLLLTGWFRENGFETRRDGIPWVPELRQGYAFKHLMENRKPIVRKDDLIAGTTTTQEIGVVLYPDSHGTMIWGELFTTPYRQLFPYDISDDTREILHHSVFPFWVHRNFKEWVRETYHSPLCQSLDDRFAVYFLWKTAALSHTVLDYPKLLKIGARGIIGEIRRELEKDQAADRLKKDTLEAMILCYEGLIAYARNLSAQAAAEAREEADERRKAELERLAEICARVPENPCTTLDEALNAIWIHWVGVHMENTNAGFSLGRMDQWLQPYFVSDLKKIRGRKKREEYIRRAIELVGCFYMRCTDHLPLIPDIGNYLFGGSSSDQAITLGGVTPEGEDAVNDMTYIFLKVTEMLGIRDPNVNARFHRGKNSETYLRRLCEVNINTTSTPSIHNDEVVMASLEEFAYPQEHLRDWAATGCVEPTLSGRHIGHTNCMMFNMVAALEMAMYNGRHPLMRWDVGPKTGNVDNGSFPTFDDFFQAFCTQLDFLMDNSCEYNRLLGEAHSVLRPTPFISGLVEGCIANGRDATKGGALYNSSGTACIGLADITDSLMAVKKLVYDEKKVTLKEIREAMETNFENNGYLHSLVRNKVPLFGSGSPEAVEMANRVTRFIHDRFGAHTNFRGGRYTAGFWSMSNHVAFGTLTGALPSGRLAGKPFTPGLTPEAHASRNLLDNIRDVSRLEPKSMNNNIAFNVKVVPSPKESHQVAVDHVYSYVKTYCDLGGMQMQFNVVSSSTLRDAMAHPENYRDLMVRISGYNAYFVTLNRDMQMELIERAEYGA